GGGFEPRPSGYEPDELPSCSTPRPCVIVKHDKGYETGATHEVPFFKTKGVTSTLAGLLIN
ncbi:hypothetical protein, partial [Vibrio cholerae]|uniref:hypothetical protein n=1 Tax=Vibrio cholerae TaxID=666 RepID=UPI001E2E9B94